MKENRKFVFIKDEREGSYVREEREVRGER
jgi:hypothetical protein